MNTWLLMPDVKKSDRKVATTFCCRFKNKNTVNLCGRYRITQFGLLATILMAWSRKCKFFIMRNRPNYVPLLALGKCKSLLLNHAKGNCKYLIDWHSRIRA